MKVPAKEVRRPNEKRIKAIYGLSVLEWEEKLKKQKGVCGICKKIPPSGTLCVDHIHIKGYKTLPQSERKKYVRGLLCFLCNTVFSKFEKRTLPRQTLENVVNYFKEYKLKGD